jgi:hypothetical protein
MRMRVLGVSETLSICNLADYVIKRHRKRLQDADRISYPPAREILLARGDLAFTIEDCILFPFDHFIPIDIAALPGHPYVIRLFPSRGPVRVVAFGTDGLTIEVSGPWSGEWLLFGEPL